MRFQIYRAQEDKLIERCKEQDRYAQEVVYQRFSGKILALCCRYVKNRAEAEDILVMTFSKVFERIDQFKGEGSFEGWIRRIAVNESLSYLRKNKNMYLETDLEAAEKEPDYGRLEGRLEAEDLMKLIEGLPSGYRIVFNMFAIDGYSHKEIADRLEITESTSKSQLSRARAILQRSLLEIEVKGGPDQKTKSV